MKKWAGLFGLLGLLILLLGLLGFFVFGFQGATWFLRSILGGHLLVGVILIVLWLVARDWHQEEGSSAFGRGARFGVSALVYAAIFVALLAVANWLANRHNKRWDLTEEGVYSLSPQSEKIVSNLKKPLKLVAFKGSQMAGDEELEDLLRLYSEANPGKGTTQLIDPRTKPHAIDQYQMKPGNLIYIEYGEGEQKGVSRINEAGEEGVTNAVLKLTRGEAKKIYIVEGHGEPGTADSSPRGLKQFSEALADEHLTLEPILLAEKSEVPQDAAAVIVVSPARSLLPAERDLLIKYAEKGGSLLLFTDPRRPDDVTKIAEHFGIEVGADLVVDLVARLFAAPALGAQIVAREFGEHAITRALKSQDPIVFTMASSVRQKSTESTGGTYAELVKSSPSAWGEKNLKLVFEGDPPTAAREDDDLKGPVALGVAYEKRLDNAAGSSPESQEGKFDKVTRVVVFGDSDWILNDGLGYFSNRDLVLNTINWMVGEEGGITIRPRSLKASIAPIASGTFKLIFALSLLVPELILVYGLFVWWNRKTAEV